MTGLLQFSGFLIRGLADSEVGIRLIKKLLETIYYTYQKRVFKNKILIKFFVFVLLLFLFGWLAFFLNEREGWRED